MENVPNELVDLSKEISNRVLEVSVCFYYLHMIRYRKRDMTYENNCSISKQNSEEIQKSQDLAVLENNFHISILFSHQNILKVKNGLRVEIKS